MLFNMKAIFNGLKCDNPECDYVEKDVKYEDYPNYINKPCPKCGWSLLTPECYELCKDVIDISENKSIPFFKKMMYISENVSKMSTIGRDNI